MVYFELSRGFIPEIAPLFEIFASKDGGSADDTSHRTNRATNQPHRTMGAQIGSVNQHKHNL